jgi:hypothetical protein
LPGQERAPSEKGMNAPLAGQNNELFPAEEKTSFKAINNFWLDRLLDGCCVVASFRKETSVSARNHPDRVVWTLLLRAYEENVEGCGLW